MSRQRSQIFLLPPLLGLGHGVSDCISGYLVGMLTFTAGSSQTGFYILLYNVLAFAGQVPVGLLFDKIKMPRLTVVTSLLLVLLSLWSMNLNPQLAVIMAGIGSAGYHVAGGMVSLMAVPGKASSPGIFAGPGVLGLAIGGILSASGSDPRIIITLLCVFLLLILIWIEFPVLFFNRGTAETAAIEIHDVVMILLLMGIAFRSAIWNVFNAIHLRDHETLLLISIAACAGKISGGFLADKFGWRNYCLLALSISVPLLAFGGYQTTFMLPGIFLLQSVTAVAIAGMHKAMPAYPGMAAGLSVGLAIALGGVPGHSGLRPSQLSQPYAVIGIGTAAAILFYIAFLKLRKVKSRTESV